MKYVVAIASLLLTALHAPALAQITSAPDGTNTGVNRAGNTFNITGGTQAGSNLFHSFQQFGLNAGQIANFLSNPAIANILGRVTGGNASIINGQVQVTGSNANLFLMNPAGIVFGANASLNVPGSFTATTANGIGIGGNWFNAVGNNNYAALVGTPNSFAFLGTQPGAIVNAGNLAVGTGQSLTLLGGTVINTGTLTAPGGTITIAAVAGEKLVRVTQDGSLLSLDLPTADKALINPLPFVPLALPALLTGGNLGNATGLTVDNGVVKLTSSGTTIPTDAGRVVLSNPINVSSLANSAFRVIGNQISIYDAPIRAIGNGSGGDITFTGDTTANKIDINTTGKVVFNDDFGSSSSIAISGSTVTAKNIRYGSCVGTPCIAGNNDVRIEATVGNIELGDIESGGTPNYSNNKTTLIAQNGDIFTGKITSGYNGIAIEALRFFRGKGFDMYTDYVPGPDRRGILRGNIAIKHGGESFQVDLGETIVLAPGRGNNEVTVSLPRPFISVIGTGTFDFVVGPDLVLERDINNNPIRLRSDVSGIFEDVVISYPGNASSIVTTLNRPFKGNVYQPGDNTNLGVNQESVSSPNLISSNNEPGFRVGQETQATVQRQINSQEQSSVCNLSTTIASSTTPEARSPGTSKNPCSSVEDDAQILKILGEDAKPNQSNSLIDPSVELAVLRLVGQRSR